jgi:hypothetical protein
MSPTARSPCRVPRQFGSRNARYWPAEFTPGRIQQPIHVVEQRIRITVLFSACFRLSQDYSPKVGQCSAIYFCGIEAKSHEPLTQLGLKLSVEIVRPDIQARDIERCDMLCLHMNDAILILQRPLNK